MTYIPDDDMDTIINALKHLSDMGLVIGSNQEGHSVLYNVGHTPHLPYEIPTPNPYNGKYLTSAEVRRLNAEEEAAKQREKEAAERAEYERLRQKYGD